MQNPDIFRIQGWCWMSWNGWLNIRQCTWVSSQRNLWYIKCFDVVGRMELCMETSAPSIEYMSSNDNQMKQNQRCCADEANFCLVTCCKCNQRFPLMDWKLKPIRNCLTQTIVQFRLWERLLSLMYFTSPLKQALALLERLKLCSYSKTINGLP